MFRKDVKTGSACSVFALWGAFASCALSAFGCSGGGLSGSSVEQVWSGRVGNDNVKILSFSSLTPCADSALDPQLVVTNPNSLTAGLVSQCEGEGQWETVGEFELGGHIVVDTLNTTAGERPVLFSRLRVEGDGDDEVTMTTADTKRPEILRTPVPIHTSRRIRAMASGDLDDDGLNELVVAADNELRRLDKVEQSLFIERKDGTRPEIVWTRFGEYCGVEIADVDVDGRFDVVAKPCDQDRLVVMSAPGFDFDLEDISISLDATPTQLAKTGCPSAPVLVVLDDGTMGAVRDDEVLELDRFEGVRRVYASGDAVAVQYEDDRPMTLHDPCFVREKTLPMKSDKVRSFAVSQTTIRGIRYVAVTEGQSSESSSGADRENDSDNGEEGFELPEIFEADRGGDADDDAESRDSSADVQAAVKVYRLGQGFDFSDVSRGRFVAE